MKKKEVAKYLGVSTKTVDRYVKKGWLEARHKHPTIHSQLEFDEEQVKALREYIHKERAIVADKPSWDYESPQEWYFDYYEKPKIAYNLSKVLPDLKEFIFNLIKPYIDDLVSNGMTELNNKLTLSLKEAAILSGLPENHIYLDLKKKKLNAVKIDKKWRIHRIDLDNYLKTVVFKKNEN